MKFDIDWFIECLEHAIDQEDYFKIMVIVENARKYYEKWKSC